MLIENVLQFIPSEAIMPLAASMVSQGKLALVPTILAGTAGTILGTVPWYLIGLYVNEEQLEAAISRYGAWFGVTSGKLKTSRLWFNRHGHLMVFWGHLVPVLRTLVSIPAGMELMPMRSFLLWTSLGRLIWNAFLTYSGYLLGEHWQVLHSWLKPVTALAVAGLIGLLLYWLFRSAELKPVRAAASPGAPAAGGARPGWETLGRSRYALFQAAGEAGLQLGLSHPRSRLTDLNRWPSLYKSAALPLS